MRRATEERCGKTTNTRKITAAFRSYELGLAVFNEPSRGNCTIRAVGALR